MIFTYDFDINACIPFNYTCKINLKIHHLTLVILRFTIVI